MIRKHSLWCLVGIAIVCASELAAREALIFGQEARENEFPYQVAVIANGNNPICGGGIIDAEHILAAAHCVIANNNLFYGNPLTVLVGSNKLPRSNQQNLVVEVKKIYVPIEYSPPIFRATGDIAVLKLRTPLDLKNLKHLKKLKLPKKHESYADEMAIIAGFGWNWIRVEGANQFGNNTDGHLRFTKTDIINKDQCKREHSLLTISDNYLCAKSKQLDHARPVGVCTGDSGSPLVINGSTVVGILSFGPSGCREIISSAIYTRVSQYLTFINNASKDKITRNMRSYNLIP